MWSYTSTPLYAFMAWCLVKKKHRDNYTFTFYYVLVSYSYLSNISCISLVELLPPKISGLYINYHYCHSPFRKSHFRHVGIICVHKMKCFIQRSWGRICSRTTHRTPIFACGL